MAVGTEATQTRQPRSFDDVERCVEAIVERVGHDIRLGVPLGLGKPVELINALYARAKRDPAIQLTLLTALSLQRPYPSGLEGALLNPFLERVYEGVVELDYVCDQNAGKLPSNVRVLEFFFQTGARLKDEQAQRDYISTNYTFAARDVYAQGCNVIAQIVAKRETAQGLRYSLSCNPDTGPELERLLRAAEARGERRIAVIAQVNQQLPYMGNDAEVPPSNFDFVVDHPRYSSALFSVPKTPVSVADHAIGLRVSTLVRDGGTLQIGIGTLGDAVSHALALRQRRNAEYQRTLAALDAVEPHAKLIEQFGGLQAFDKGLYGASEMIVDGFLHLLDAGVIKREVYDFWALQQLVDEGVCDPQQLDASVLEALAEHGVRLLRTQDFERLRHHGLFVEESRYEDGEIIAPNGERIPANLANPRSREAIAQTCFGTQLRNGIVLHGGFFLGPRRFYQALRDMPEDQRNRICMTGVERINQLDLNPRLYKAQRLHARFINTAMMATLSGAIVSDGLEDGRVVSGVGGQYNFVAQAHQLHTGRSILLLRAVREANRKASSNILFDYGHCTIPRHLRDIVVTEYGIADLRAQTDEQVARSLIEIADSRFQAELIEKAQQAGKLARDYRLPERCRNNSPERLARCIEVSGEAGALFPAFPLGHDFTEQELRLAKGLKAVQAIVAETPRLKLLLRGLRPLQSVEGALREDLQRLALVEAKGLQNRVARSLLIEQLHKA